MKNSSNPTASKKWGSFHRTHTGTTKNKDFATINRFIARYRLARSFQGLHLDDYSKKIINGYNGIFHVYLAFSAFECLLNGIKLTGVEMNWDKTEHNHKFTDAMLANKIRLNTQLLRLLVENLDAKKLINKVIDFQNSLSSDVAPVVKGIRNLVAHGELSATGAVAGSQKHTNALHELATLVLDDSDKIFTGFVSKIASTP
jgi:hypothetical protein